jgi:hypothetical protein
VRRVKLGVKYTTQQKKSNFFMISTGTADPSDIRMRQQRGSSETKWATNEGEGDGEAVLRHLRDTHASINIVSEHKHVNIGGARKQGKGRGHKTARKRDRGGARKGVRASKDREGEEAKSTHNFTKVRHNTARKRDRHSARKQARKGRVKDLDPVGERGGDERRWG